MKKEERARLRLTLQQLRDRLLGTEASKIEPNRRDPASTGVADEDAQALSEMLQVLASQRNKGQAALVARIDRALAKLASRPADFGLGESGEKEIPRRGLALMPYAELCAACQAKQEPHRLPTRRKLTD